MTDAETPPHTPPGVGQTPALDLTTPGLDLTPTINAQGEMELPNGIDVKSLTAADVSAIAEAGSKGGTFLCLLCKKKFGYKNGLIRHVRLTHVGEKPYECNICNRRFGYKHILMEHQNLHFGNRPYACNLCDKKFAARSNLIQHRSVHKRPYNCTMCNKRFDKEDQLKKHLFAHPQALLNCNFCQYSATSQKDLSKHLTDCHAPAVIETRSKQEEEMEDDAIEIEPEKKGVVASPLPPQEMSNDSVPPSPRQAHRPGNLTPDIPTPHPPHQLTPEPERIPSFPHHQVPLQHTQNPISHQNDGLHQRQSPPTSMYSPRLAAAMAEHHSPKNLRVDTLSNPLTFNPGSLSHLGLPGDHHQISIKKEIQEDYDSGCGSSNPHKSPVSEESDAGHSYSSPDPTRLGEQAYPNLPTASPPLSIATQAPTSAAPPVGALPGIQEMFSRRPPRLPGFANFALPGLFSGDNRYNVPHPEPLPLSLMSPPAVPLSNGSSPPGSLPSSGSRPPSSQLPPIAHMLRQPKEEQGSPISPQGIPGLDHILSYYVNQGKLFKCQHCNILFFERGMYFLHASLHAHNDPWECSICHKVCSDKNEFTIHFVNQQHTNT